MARQKFGYIYGVLKKRIEEGVYRVGELLPTEHQFIEEFECSRNTVRRALGELTREGYVLARQGRGVCNIFQPIEEASYTMGTIESFRETARRTGQKARTEVVKFERRWVDADLATASGFAEGSEVFYVVRLHYLDDVPSILNETYLLAACMPELTIDNAQQSLYQYFEEELGMLIVTSKRIVTVDPASELDCTYLNVSSHDYVAVVSNHVYNSLGVLFEYTQSRHIPRIFRFQDNAVRQYIDLQNTSE